MLKKRFCLALLVIIISITFISFSAGNYPINSPTDVNTSIIQSHDKVLIIAPHPDDEAIGCAGVIRYCVENNISVKIVVLTDGYLSASPVKRHDESVNGMKMLGVPQDDIIFLGYPDGTLPMLLTKNWNHKSPYNINGTTTNGNYPYSYQQNASYSGESLFYNLMEIINNYEPTVILYPDSEDEQIDHWATNAFMEYAMAKINYKGNKYTYIVHDAPYWPSPRKYTPEAALTPPVELTYIDYKWVAFPLDEYQERLKEASIDSYESQISSDSYIRSFIRKNELFGISPVIKSTLSNESLNFSNNTSYLENVIKEPRKYQKGKGSIRSREITAAGFNIDNDNVWLSIRTKGNISLDEWYEIHLLFLNTLNSQRIDIQIHNGTAYYQKYSNDSVQSDSQAVKIVDNGIIIKLPSSSFRNVDSFLMSADVISGSTLIDWTGWREVEIVR